MSVPMDPKGQELFDKWQKADKDAETWKSAGYRLMYEDAWFRARDWERQFREWEWSVVEATARRTGMHK